jgi:uncharacterized membrane protein YkvI
MQMSSGRNLFTRLVLPGFAFKAVVIGGGYATGREIATFFLPSGPRGGVYAILLGTAVWSVVCALTFLFAFQTGSRDYRSFFRHLLGPLWPLFECAYLPALVVILAVYAAAAGAIVQAVFGLPQLVGALGLMVCITLIAMWGNAAVERLFKYVSLFLYGVYAIFVGLALTRFGDRISHAFSADIPATGWALGGLTYAGYNIVGAAVILPVARHLTSRRDALIAGVLAGPLAMAPALFFFICMLAFYPGIKDQPLPSDFLLARLESPTFRIIFQLMILSALLESGTGGVHAINERIAQAYRSRRGRALPPAARLAAAALLLIGSVFIAARFGLVALIAGGYQWIAYAILAVYVLPLLTHGLWRIVRWRNGAAPSPA